MMTIKINQVGYQDNERQWFLSHSDEPFFVSAANSKAVIKKGNMIGPFYDPTSQETWYQGSLDVHAGHYEIKQGNHQTDVFVDAHPYRPLHKALLNAFYYLRCGIAIEAGPFSHGPCHTDLAFDYEDESKQVDVSGGWHDAGDYGKYVVAAGKACADLCLSYELYPDVFNDQKLEHSHSTWPQVIDELIFEADFLMKMQREDGAVYHKVTTKEFPSNETMPEADTEPLVLSPVSNTATYSLAATLAYVSRIIKPFDEERSEAYLHAAKRAFDRAEVGDLPAFKNPVDITTGEYGDDCTVDEAYWASYELYRTTRDHAYFEAFERYEAESFDHHAFGWSNMGGYGTVSFLLDEEAEVDSVLYQRRLKAFIKVQEDRIKTTKKYGNRTTMKEEDFVWGSNMGLLNQAMGFLIAYKLTTQPDFEQKARDQFHYLLGRNTLGISYVTGFGDHAVKHIHYRPLMALNNPALTIPGFVSGGPNKNLQDEIAEKKLVGRSAQGAFIDHYESYSTNEVTIYWNSPAVFVCSHFY